MMDKKRYLSPELEVQVFENVDVLTGSLDEPDTGTGDLWGPDTNSTGTNSTPPSLG